MFKRLFLVIFIFQTFASSAWAGMNMSQFNQAEQQQMQIMHVEMNKKSLQSMDLSNSNQMPCCDHCNSNSHCNNLMCVSMHATSHFLAQEDFAIISVSSSNTLLSLLTHRVNYSNHQPETPPPAL